MAFFLFYVLLAIDEGTQIGTLNYSQIKVNPPSC
ncbi:MAG: hypothetical protein K0S80_3058, partial [Neobacillus sp.]|nr:hypothetical protein [Neobacillus sp.]